jgi:hypothetical protein
VRPRPQLGDGFVEALVKLQASVVKRLLLGQLLLMQLVYFGVLFAEGVTHFRELIVQLMLTTQSVL